MEELLHSKRFMDNLKKWLCMYIGVIGILATVVTYSKYISSMHSTDEAHPANFKITLDCGTGSTLKENTDNVCTAPESAPLEAKTYSFKVDTNYDVDTVLVLRIYVDNNFRINSVKKNGEAADNAVISPSTTQLNGITKKLITITYNIKANDPDVHDTYGLVLQYNGEVYSTPQTFGDLIIINYSATQTH